VLEVHAGQRGLEQRGEDVPVTCEPLELVLRNELGAALRQQLPEAELPRNDRAARAGDDVRADLRQPPLRKVRVAVVQRAGDRQLQDAVAEELEPLVRRGAIGRPGAVREDVLEPPMRQLRDELGQLLRPAGGRTATGAL
jgi:hypothetical protein